MQANGAEALLAQIFADRLGAVPLDGPVAAIALKLAALSDNYETLVPKLGNPVRDAALVALARGTAIPTPSGAVQSALSAGFDGAAAPADLARLVSQNQIGEAVLRAITVFEAGMQGDPSQLTDALRLFRQGGLEDVARRAALQALVLGRNTG